MSLQRVLADLATRYPAEDQMVPDVERITLLLDLLGSPQRAYPSIHLTGTNGKSSTARMVDALLQGFGLRPGRYTSPHLDSVTERITIDGQPLSEERFAEVYDELRPYVEIVDSRMPVPLTFFEILTLAALLHFEAVGVDVMVLEAGLGGRLDATRAARFAVTLFAPIDLDHTAYLGPDVTAIAGEKAAVMEDGAPAFSAPQQPEAGAVLQVLAMRFGVTLRFVEPLAHPPRGLPGEHQRSNAALALAGARVIDSTVTAADLDDVRWPGRLERVPLGAGHLLLDVAHNPHGVAALVEHLGAHPARRAVLFGCLADKDAPSMLRELTTLDTPLWLTTPPGGGHVLDTPPGARSFPDPDDPTLRVAIDELLASGGELVVCGSHHLVGHLRAALLGADTDARWLSDPLTRAQ